MAITLTHWACVADHALQTQMAMGYVMTSIFALAPSMNAACNGPGAIYDCGCEAIPAGDCDCDGNQLDALGVCGGDCVHGSPMRMASAMTLMIALAPWTTVASATVLVRFTTAVVRRFQQVIAIVMAISLMPGCLRRFMLFDADGDGVCDDVDTCIGIFDACGICNGHWRDLRLRLRRDSSR